MSYSSHHLVRRHWLSSLITSSILLLASSFFPIAIARAASNRATINDELDTVIASIVSDQVSDSPQTLNVHVVPHSHDDAGWLKTYDQCYHGWNDTIQKADVRSILDTVVDALEVDPNRRFAYGEISFFSRWWEEQTDDRRESVGDLVRRHRLAFVNGGWVMHDEACAHYLGMIDQTTLGHGFLSQTFDGLAPRSGWQLDPFGHSTTQVSLLTSYMGFDAVYLGRMDYRDLEQRMRRRQTEGLWSPANSPPDATTFWSKTGSMNSSYSPPKGYCFDQRCRRQADPNTADVDEFVEKLIVQADETIGNNIMLTWGSDFQYENATDSFHRTDVFLARVRQALRKEDVPPQILGEYDTVNIFYSTPDVYTLAKHRERGAGRLDGTWEVKNDDFFPYAQRKSEYWTGFFTSRPTIKRMDRIASAFLLAARQVDAVMALSSRNTSLAPAAAASPLQKLERASGILQHHDAVTGTAKQHVTNDYVKRLDEGFKEAADYMSQTLSALIGGDSIELSYCQYLNETKCPTSQAATEELSPKYLFVVVYNPLGQERVDEIVSIPVSSDATYEVRIMKDGGTEGNPLQSVLMPRVNCIGDLDCTATMQWDGTSTDEDAAPYVLHVQATMPPVGCILFRIHILSDDSSAVRPLDFQEGKGGNVISNGNLQFSFDQNGMMTRVSNDNEDIKVDLNQVWGYYPSFEDHSGKKHPARPSDAYVFRPASNEDVFVQLKPVVSKIYQSNLVTEVHSQFAVDGRVAFQKGKCESCIVRQITKVKKRMNYVEIEYNVGPLPVDDGIGKEMVTNYHSSVINGGLFYTDANSREFVQRRLNARPSWNLSTIDEPISGNYYPVTSAIYIEDEQSSFSVLTDRSQGGSSLVDGSVELMVHRRTAAKGKSDTREALNETDGYIDAYPPYGNFTVHGQGIVVSGTHRLGFGKGKEGASIARAGMDPMLLPPLLFFAESGGARGRDSSPLIGKLSFSALQRALPDNVMLTTFAKTRASTFGETFLLRVSHQYGVGEDRELSHPVQIDLATLFHSFIVSKISETTLSANQRRVDWIRRKLQWKTTEGNYYDGDSGTTIRLNPMQMRTFEVTFQSITSTSDYNKGSNRGALHLSKASVLLIIVALLVGFAFIMKRGRSGSSRFRRVDMDDSDLELEVEVVEQGTWI